MTSHAEPELRQRADAIVDRYLADTSEYRDERLREAIARDYGKVYDQMLANEHGVIATLLDLRSHKDRTIRALEEAVAQQQETIAALQSVLSRKAQP